MKERRNQNQNSVISIKRCQKRKKKIVSHFDYQIEFEDKNCVGYGNIECHKNVSDRLLIEMRCCRCNKVLV